LPKWHGNPGAVFAEQAVTPSQEQVKTPPHRKRFTAGHFFDSIDPDRTSRD
jgi:hypothetical protein